MPLIQLTPGELAQANDVNANFNYILSLIGEDSTPDRMRSDVEIEAGSRGNTLLTGRQDISGAPTERKFYQIGWNADWNYVDGKWRFSRFVEGEPSTVMRLGWYGFEVMVTSTTGGNLNGQLEPIFAVRATTGDDYVYIKNSFGIQGIDRDAQSIQDYRLTYVALDVPAIIYDGVALTNQDTSRNAGQFGVPSHAKMIRIRIEAKAGPNDAYIRFSRHEAEAHSRRYGFTMYADANKWNSMEGDVRLGEGAYANEFRITRVQTFTTAFAYVVGYWT